MVQYPTDFPIAELKDIIQQVTEPANINKAKLVNDLYTVLGYALKLTFGDPTQVVGSQPVGVDSAIDMLQNIVNSHEGVVQGLPIPATILLQVIWSLLESFVFGQDKK